MQANRHPYTSLIPNLSGACSILVASVVLMPACATKPKPPVAPTLNPVEGQFHLAGANSVEMGMLVRRIDDTGFAFESPPNCFSEFEKAYTSEQIDPVTIQTFTSAKIHRASLGVNYKVIEGLFDLDTSSFYEFNAKITSAKRAKPKPGVFDAFSYCCSVNEDYCRGLNGNTYDSVVTEVGELIISTKEFEHVDTTVSGGDVARVVTVDGGFYRETSRGDERRLFYFRTSPLPAISAPDPRSEITVSPLRVVHHPLGGKTETFKALLSVSISANRRNSYTVTLEPLHVPDVSLETLGANLVPSNTYSNTVSVSCKGIASSTPCAATLGTTLTLMDPGSQPIRMTVVDDFAGNLGTVPLDGFEVVKRVTPGQDGLSVTQVGKADLINANLATVAMHVKAPGSTAANHAISVSPFHAPSFLQVAAGACSAKGTDEYECTISVTREPGLATLAAAETVIVQVRRENVPTLSYPQAILVELPQATQITPSLAPEPSNEGL